MCHSSAKLLWEQIQGHIRLAHTRQSWIPLFFKHPSFVLFFYKHEMKTLCLSGRVMFYLRWPASTMNFTWQQFHPTTSLNLSSLVSRALILQPGHVAPPTRSPGMRAESCCSQAYPFSLPTTTKTQPALKHCLRDLPRDRSAASAPPPNASRRNPLPPPAKAIWRYTDVSRGWAGLAEHPICCKASGGHR